MKIYDKRYSYEGLGKAKVAELLYKIYDMLDVYGAKSICEINSPKDKKFNITLHYQQQSSEQYYYKNIIIVQMTNSYISKSKYIPNSIHKKSVSYHKSFKSLKLTTDDYKEILREETICISSRSYIKYLPVKIGKIRVSYKSE